MYLLLSFLFLFRLAGSADITGPAAVRGPVGGRLAVHCRYEPGWKIYRKWWCRGAVWSSCRILVRTDGSEREAKHDRVSIKDDWKSQMFTVTMEKLRWNDTDAYWCGIERTGVDSGVVVKVVIDPAAGVSPEQVVQPPEGEADICYANLALQSTSTSHKSSQKKGCTKPSSSAQDDEPEVEYVTMAPLQKEEIPYADLSWELLNQDATYCNMSFHVAHVPSRSHEESMEYSSIRRSKPGLQAPLAHPT
ncbi:CMRF35-like molecule 1 isoform X3 [Mustela lutreola]|uniref:CMRF35-like molecule 1 isoform X3 n=1 Tax=Mustela lutreola TaxID=9666 RepID=UPI00279731CE|nr:CMRF35-like molecule 1 isoform X3 [Mustela lutreola]